MDFKIGDKVVLINDKGAGGCYHKYLHHIGTITTIIPDILPQYAMLEVYYGTLLRRTTAFTWRFEFANDAKNWFRE